MDRPRYGTPLHGSQVATVMDRLRHQVAELAWNSAGEEPLREEKEKMTAKADFTQDEWDLIREGPPSAGLIVVTAQRGGTIRESIAMGKAYVEARRQHGESELLDEIVAAKPERDHTRYHSVDELKQAGLQHLRDAVELLERKATAEEVEDYRRFVVNLADKVAKAHRENGEQVSEAETQAIKEISASLGSAEE